MDHWAVLFFIAVTTSGLVFNARKILSIRDDRFFRRLLGLALLLSGVASWSYYFVHELVLFSFELCDLILFLTVWALWTKKRWAAELSFFWGLAGSSQAILTPDVPQAFPGFLWFTFFLNHSLAFLSAVYLSVKGYVQVSGKLIWRAWMLLNLYAGIAGILNWKLGTNFGYLARKPAHPSLLDYLGPWPYYILWTELIALGLFSLCYAFNRVIEKMAGPRQDINKTKE